MGNLLPNHMWKGCGMDELSENQLNLNVQILRFQDEHGIKVSHCIKLANIFFSQSYTFHILAFVIKLLES